MIQSKKELPRFEFVALINEERQARMRKKRESFAIGGFDSCKLLTA
jgi:hypothetical protein